MHGRVDGEVSRVWHLRHEHLAPSTLFSVVAFEQLQERAGCLPQEQVALLAQTQVLSPERLQQVDGTAIVSVGSSGEVVRVCEEGGVVRDD